MATMEAEAETLTISAPLEEETQQQLDLDRLINEERPKLAQRGEASTYLSRTSGGVRSFTQAAAEAHTDLLQRFSGWRWHSPVYEAEHVDEDGVGPMVERLWSAHKASFHDWRKWPLVDCYNTAFRTRIWAWDTNERWSIGWTDENCYQAIRIKLRKGAVVSRAILAELEKLLADRDPEQRKLYMAFWTKLFAELGQFWAAKQKMRVTISAAPSDFAWLGDIEATAGSSTCYRTGGEYEHSKYNLARTRNSFVMLFYRNGHVWNDESPSSNLYDGDLPDARAWGFFTDKGAVLSNIYRLPWATVEPVVASALQDAFGWSSAQRCGVSLNINSDYAYPNNDERGWLAPEATARQLESAVGVLIDGAATTLNLRRTCSCGNRIRNGESYLCDGCESQLCGSCAHYCRACDQHFCTDCRAFDSCGDCGVITCECCSELYTCDTCNTQACDSCYSRAFDSCDNCEVCTCRACSSAVIDRETPLIVDLGDNTTLCVHCLETDEEHALRAAAILQLAHSAALFEERDREQRRIYAERQRTRLLENARDDFFSNFWTHMEAKHGYGWYQPFERRIQQEHRRYATNEEYIFEFLPDFIAFARESGELRDYDGSGPRVVSAEEQRAFGTQRRMVHNRFVDKLRATASYCCSMCNPDAPLRHPDLWIAAADEIERETAEREQRPLPIYDPIAAAEGRAFIRNANTTSAVYYTATTF